MQVNNETGAMLDVAALAEGVKRENPRCFVHVDGVQAFCKHPLQLKKTAIDGYAVSAHKLHGPKGVGALYLRGGRPGHFTAPFAGGGQESAVRPGTENVASAAAFAKAVELESRRLAGGGANTDALRRQLLRGLGEIPGCRLLSPPDASPYITMFAMEKGLRSQVVLNYLDTRDICVSSGSACGGGAPSHTLRAMGLPREVIDTALRASFCGGSTPADVDALLAGLRGAAKKLARA
jgi:cysteine desulfurase